MKRILIFAVFAIVFFVLNSKSYAQSYDFQPFYNQTFANQGTIPSFSSWTLLNQDNSFPNYTQSMYNYQTSLPFERSSNFNINPLAGWLNHPPITIYSPTRPMVIKAGQSSTFNYWVVDPDADRLYSSSNFGSTGRYTYGSLAWNFSPNFPGQYLVETVVYDERGAFAAMRSPVYVKSWWSF